MAETKKKTEEVTAEVTKAEAPKAPADPNAKLKELVPFYAFKDNDKYKDDITVGVNGRMFRIKRGEQVMIPRYVYNVLMRSMNQDAKTADLMDAKSNAYAREARGWNV